MANNSDGSAVYEVKVGEDDYIDGLDVTESDGSITTYLFRPANYDEVEAARKRAESAASLASSAAGTAKTQAYDANVAAGAARTAAAKCSTATENANAAVQKANAANDTASASTALASNAAAAANGAASHAEAAANQALQIANSVAQGAGGESDIAELRRQNGQLATMLADATGKFIYMDGTVYCPASKASVSGEPGHRRPEMPLPQQQPQGVGDGLRGLPARGADQVPAYPARPAGGALQRKRRAQRRRLVELAGYRQGVLAVGDGGVRLPRVGDEGLQRGLRLPV